MSSESSADDLPAKLERLKASATKEYSLKNYDQAAEYYSEAAQVQDGINGEMATENADLLYHYGRCLYRVAVANSDVLGGKVASTEEPKRKKRKVTKATESHETGEGSSVIADAVQKSEEKSIEEAADTDKDTSARPYFQITGDENFTDSEDEEDEAEAEEDEDDFQTAYEILDMARILLSRKLEEGSEAADQRQLKERLADTHDLQAEISLENERFQDAIKDSRDALRWKLQLYPEENSLVAEAHFKLSLALEFASVTSTEETPDGQSKIAQVDEQMRKEAAREMELAIASCRARVTKEEATLPSLDDAKAADVKKGVEDVQEMIGDMVQRLEDLRKPATSLSAMQSSDGVLGLLGSASSKDEQNRKIEAANDVSGMIKKKKRKTEEDEQQGAKKVKFEDAANGDSNVAE